MGVRLKESSFLRVLCALVVLCVAFPGVAAADSPEYAALYTGNMSDTDYDWFWYHFASHAWSCEVAKSTNTSYKPRHYHFTHGPNDNNVEGADDADILYV